MKETNQLKTQLNPTRCEYCGAQKEKIHLAYRSCYSRLPRTYKDGFIQARRAAEQWLREHSHGNNASTS